MKLTIIYFLFFLNVAFIFAVESAGEKFKSLKNEKKVREIRCLKNNPECISRKSDRPKQKKIQRNEKKSGSL